MHANNELLESMKTISSDKQQFEIGAPSGSQLPTGAPVSLTNSDGSFGLEWADQRPQELDAPRAEDIFDDIVARSRHDVDVNSSSARAHANLGNALLNLGRLEEAAHEFEVALTTKPTHFFAKASLARIRTMQSNFDVARQLYESLERDNPGSALPLLSLAHIAMRQSDYELAIGLLDRVIEVDEKDVGAHYQMAIALLALGKPNDAIRHLRMASRSEVLSPSVYHSLGVAFAVAGESPKAIRAFKTALTLAPDMRETVHALSDVLLREGQLEPTIELLSKYLERKPDDYVAHNLMGHALLGEAKYARARTHFVEALRTDEKEEVKIGLLNNIGVCYARQRQFDEAISWYTRATVSNFVQIVPYHNIARLRIIQGNVEAAGKILETCFVNFPKNLETHVIFSLLLRKKGLCDEAIERLQSLIAAGKVSVGIYSFLGSLLADDRRQYAASLSVLREGHQRFPGSVKIINNLAYSLLMMDDISSAEKLLNSLPKGLSPESERVDVTVMATRGLLCLRKGDLRTGIDLYRTAEALARRYHEIELAAIVKQKMHLEVARTYQRAGNLFGALEEVKLGLAARGSNEAYDRDLRELRNQITSDK
jgi:tetratricopeptide (TPR) repeat protein